MARTTDYLTFMVDVTPYEHEGNNYNALNIIVAYRKGQGFVICWQPVRKTDMGYITGPMPSRDPLVGGKGFVAKEASRNNAKILEMMKAALLLGAEGIKFFFDQRNYDRLKEFMCDVCNYGYTADVEKQLQETINNNSTDNNSKSSTTMAKKNMAQNESANVQNAQVNNQADEQPKQVTQKKKAIAEQQPAKFSVVPYTNKQGETGYFLFGFASQEEAKGLADRMAKSVREGFRYEDHTRYDVVGFPPRYAQMAQQMCDALNAGDAAAVAKIAASTFDVYAAAVADGKAESDRKRAERKEAEAKAKAKEVAKVKKSAGLYSKEDVAAMMQTLLNGGDVPEDIKALLAKVA